jgi:hypothetical protein
MAYIHVHTERFLQDSSLYLFLLSSKTIIPSTLKKAEYQEHKAITLLVVLSVCEM